MSDMARGKRSGALWLIRPGVFQRFVNVVAGIGVAVCGLLVIGATAGTPAVWWALPFYIGAGILFSSPRRMGARVHRGAVELHTIVSCTRVPLDDVTRIHMDYLAALLGVEQRGVTHYLAAPGHQSEQIVEAMKSDTRELAEHLGVPLIEYSADDSFGAALRGSRVPGWSARGFFSVLRWPEVWCTTLVASLILLAMMG